ncbi:TPA: 16S rRNA (guanine(527)-N(7))-methyltransferase RsmG [Candidatus Dependentiae bacterium]|nr:16S rRNA (guanine(527)-N(7))-methyltransferase RsmG [Candidatus Dependentiae bacterium]
MGAGGNTMVESAEMVAIDWQNFKREASLTEQQLAQFQQYYELLIEWNRVHNLTTITDLKEVIHYHFLDSLLLGKFVDFSTLSAIADIGTGAGFPGLPLKIKYPHLSVVLIEVTEKKRQFLRVVCEALGLENVEIEALDWRTFLRKTSYHIDLFCARASLQPEELIFMLKPSSPYRDATLVYWAANDWQSLPKEAPLILKEELYRVGARWRKYVFFKNKNLSQKN